MSEREDEHLISSDVGGNKVINYSDQTSGVRPSAVEAEQAAKKKKMIKWGLIGGAITIVVVLAIVLPIVLSSKGSSPGPPGPTPGPPKPFPDMYNPYNVTGVDVNTEDTIKGYVYTEQEYNDPHHNLALQRLVSGLKDEAKINTTLMVTYPHKIPEGPNNKFIKNISYEFTVPTPSIGLFTMGDAMAPRYSVPESEVHKPAGDITQKIEMLGFSMFHDPFGFQLADIRNESNVYVTTKNQTLVFMDKFIQMDMQLPSQKMFGFGERVREFQLGEGTWTMWARGADSPYDDGTGAKQTYGVHPFILVQTAKKGEFFGMWFRNSNAQSPLIKYDNTTGGSTLSYITTGGLIEIYFFIHGSAKEVIKNYHWAIGRPELPPFWALGWNQASWAYDTQEEVEWMVNNYTAHNIPLETAWLDIQYMDKYADFSVDTKTFPDLKGFAKKLHDNRQHIVVILDGGLSADNLDNKYYKLAQEMNVLIKSAIHAEDDKTFNGSLVMKVWPNHTVFIDWLHPNATALWSRGLLDLYDLVPYDGLWIDMNEATGFVNGELDTSKITPPTVQGSFKSNVKRFLVEYQDEWYKSFPQDQPSTWNLPFVPGYNNNEQNLDFMTLSLNATHPDSGLTEYDLHNLYGHMMAGHTRAFMTHNTSFNTDNRPFILTRSTFSGSGRYASHWLGDNFRDWSYMNYSIAGIMNMNMFGIPHTGADVCGFFGQHIEPEMCARWIQLATFYPFARMHQNRTFHGEPLINTTEPYNLEGAYLTMARDSIFDRYQYLRHMYTCLYESMMIGQTCFDPLFYYFPEDDNVHKNYEEQFMVGSAIKVAPILVPGVSDSYPVYFPKGIWVNLADYSEIVTGPITKNISAKMTVNAHLRPGSLIPFQDNSQKQWTKTAQLIEQPVSIIANRDENGHASGTVLLERGISRSEINGGQHEYYSISLQAKTLQKQLVHGTHGAQKNAYFDKLVILNAEDLKDVDFACLISVHFETSTMKVSYDDTKKALTIEYQPTEIGKHLAYHEFRQISFGNTMKDVNFCEDKAFNYKIKDPKSVDLTKSSQSFILVNKGTAKRPDLNITLQIVDSNILNVKWTIAQLPTMYRRPFEVPKSIINVEPKSTTQQLEDFIDIDLTADTFEIKIQNHKGDYVLTIKDILLDQNFNFVEATHNTLKEEAFTGIFGLGERSQTDDLFYKDGIYSMWNMDNGMPHEDGKPAGKNIYGTHPFYMYQNAEDVWVGVFTNLVAAQDWIILNDKAKGEVNTRMIAVGGVTDMYFIIDSTPSMILAGYLNIVGKPVLIPQWALGWHQCRWGYNTTEMLYDVVKGYEANKIPLDTMWSDIDYMFNYRDFTYDSKQKFKNLPHFIADIHRKNLKYVPIIDAGIAMRSEGVYPAYDQGVKDDIFIKINVDQIAVGRVWPKDAAYPDFFNPKAKTWWKDQLTTLHEQLPFDGLWEDMNEASNFCGGTCYPENHVEKSVKYQLPYTPTGKNLELQSIPLNAYHYGGYIELDTHSLFGTMEVETTHDWFQEKKKRTFIIERSSSAGIGKFGSKWLGDNEATVQDMGQSVLGIMSMNMFGVPFTGSDICGFGGNTNGELCARWHMVGAFQPFSRNHNAYGSISQEPYVFKAEQYGQTGVTYMDIMKKAILIKYSLIRYYYSQLFSLSIHGGAPVYKPLFIDFPNDRNAYKDPKYNVMIGDSLKVSVLSDKTGQDHTGFYFPAGTWCNLLNPEDRCIDSKGDVFTLNSRAFDAYAHIKAGKIVPLQDAFKLNIKKTLTTHDLQEYPVELHILGKADPAYEAYWYAEGTYYNDDGLTVDQNGTYSRYQFQASEVATETESQKILFIVNTQNATLYQDKVDPYCYSVNKNDFVSHLHFYNGEKLGFKTGKNFLVTYFLQDPKKQGFYANKPIYDEDTDRLSFEFDTPVCLSTIKYLEIDFS